MMIYFDNSATTFKKPKSVLKATIRVMKKTGGNAGRGGHFLAAAAADEIYKARETVSNFFNIDNPERVCFVSNATTALNFGIKGILNENDHVIISDMEHNSVLRPLEKLKLKNVNYDIFDFYDDQKIDSLESYIKPETKLIIVNHVSNVTGDIANIEKIGKIAKKNNIVFMVDASQSAGHLEVDVKKQNIDILALSGHKGLFGPQGSGILYLKDTIMADTVIEGGTGSLSELFTQPFIMPDRYEAGTLPTQIIAGLKEGIDFVTKKGLDSIRNHELKLAEFLIKGLKKYDNIILYGNKDLNKRSGVVSFNLKGWDSVVLSSCLSESDKICTRGGLHCSYLAHKKLNTLEVGTVRVSFSIFNTLKEVQNFISAIDRIV